MGACVSQPRTQPEPVADASAIFAAEGLKHASRSISRGRSVTTAAPGACLDASELDDDTLGEVLSALPLQHLLQLSGCSRRLFELVHCSDKVLKAVDLQQLPTHKLAPALAFLAAHPAADSIHTATLPSNLAGSAAAVAALRGLQQLTLYRAGKAPFPEPELTSLPVAQLSHLTSLSLELASGDVPAGHKLALPAGLQELSLTAPTFGSAINPLDLHQLAQLARLKVSVLDSANSKSLTKLLALPGLKHLSLGRFWSLPDVLHSFSSLCSLEVFLYGKVVKGGMCDLEMPLSAAACGLCSLPTRPNLHLQVHISVLSECDGLAPDWASLGNLRTLQLDNIYPASSGAFDLGALSELGRLAQLQLGFEGQKALPGRFQRLELQQLHQLVHLKDLSVTCSGPWVELVLEGPRHLSSLLVACQGRLLLAAPGTAVAAEAAAAAKRAAQLGQQSSIVMRLSLDAPPTPTSPAASGSSPASASPPGSPSNAAAAATGSSPFSSIAANKLMGGLSGGWLSHGASSGGSNNGSLIGAACGPQLHSLGSAGSAGSLGSPQPSWTAGSLGGGSGKDAFAQLPELGLSDGSVLLMQRRLDRLGSIGESEEAYNQDDEAEQLSHISRLGLLTGQGIRMLDPSLARCSSCSSVGGSCSATCSQNSSVTGAGGMARRRQGPNSVAGKQAAGGAEGVMPLDSWLAAKGLNLATLQLVEQHLSSPRQASSFSRSSSLKHAGSGPAGSVGCGAAGYSLLARQHMEDQLLSTFREWGFAT